MTSRWSRGCAEDRSLGKWKPEACEEGSVLRASHEISACCATANVPRTYQDQPSIWRL
ncbi:hypothetical protein BAUCODRAFT_119984 [Baudoinia panamericana UAMH 10762]|uniref:Uncharacterized protein n=1 Tax=Baudoinia panamericana (strain UAMH 10762) TaxID=717646 RepID=M2NH67_BAUPA|nr:uncharacterized protein BAUCODRAFT_119984 [Baudoinia panamericana UAMH 10762]EMC98679.1 hypothetical protein BAUCODRAFT_119984 [Baudoinia panamericana UAMH 10762]